MIKRGLSLQIQILRKTFLPLVIVVLAFILYLVYSVNIKPLLNENIIKFITKAFLAIFVSTVAFLIQRITSGILRWYSQNIAIKTETKFDDEFTPLLKRITNIIIWIIAVLVILSNFGININALIATLGVGSLAIALAAQDTIANMIAGFLIMVDRPFRLGDEIKLPSGEKVRVIEIGIRRSRFLNLEDDSIIIMPNLDMSKSKIVNFTYGRERKNA